MPKYIEGDLTVGKQRFALVISRFNEFITGRLVEGAVDTLLRHGCTEDRITCIRVPGSFELPLAAKKVAASGDHDAVICLGCVIRGQTPHFEHVAGQAARGIATASLETGVPISFGVVTADTLEQAVERAGSKAGNRGADAAAGAIEMTNLLAKLSGASK
jgi:6,7-dimethyl-8-ribityllumazine synthase